MTGPDDTQPSPASIVPPEDLEARVERAQAAYLAFWLSMKSDDFLEDSWEELSDYEKRAWLCAADAAYHHVVVSPT